MIPKDRSTLFAIAMFSLLIAFFSLYPPVSFILSGSTTTKLGNMLILVFFFSVMSGLTLYSLWVFNKSSQQNLKAFDYVLKNLTSIPSDAIQEELHKVKSIFTNSLLKNVWANYEKTIRKIDDGRTSEGEIKQRYYASVESSYFFNEEVVYNNLTYYKFISYVPQMLTALGIFGTFLGLVIGLVGVDFQDTANTKSSIELLLNGVQIAFRTSIYGIAFSLVLTVYQKMMLGKQEAKICEISDQIDLMFTMNTQADGVNQLYVELEKQTASIQKMGTEIAESVASKFDTSLQNTLGPTLEKFAETTEKLFEAVNNSNQSTVSSLVDNIGSIISSSAGKELERLESSIGSLTERNEGLLSEFEKTIQSLQSLMHSQESIITETNQSTNNAKQLNETIFSVTDELATIISGLNSFTSVQQTSYQDYLELVNNVRETLEQQDKSASLFKDTVQQTVHAAEMQKQAGERFTNVVGRLDEFGINFQGVLTSMKDGTSSFVEASQTVCNKFDTTISRLGETHETISLSIKGLSEGLNESINSLQGIVSGDFQKISSRYAEIAEKLEGFGVKSDRLVNQLTTFTETNNKAVQLWGNYKDSFEALNNEISKGVQDYQANISSGLQNLFKDYDEHISKVLGDFKSTIESFDSSIEELTDALDPQNLKVSQQHTSKIIHDFNTVLQHFGGKMDELKEVYQQSEAVRMTGK